MEKSKSIHFQGLSLLRFVAAFMVIIYHSTLSIQDRSGQHVKFFLRNLLIGVDLFLIIRFRFFLRMF
jgi:peptidoglycan/LPS O-acetylase OafA/YrhL